jgi:prepilin-type N-terminal cleavage/methylation domain-containing protein
MRRAFTLVEIMMVIMILGILVAIATPTWISARENGRRRACVANLKQIEGAKEQWGMDTKAAPTDEPASTDLYGPSKYVKFEPTCPSGGKYTIGTLATPVTCDRPAGEGHVLP